jgi:hypothetical protein
MGLLWRFLLFQLERIPTFLTQSIYKEARVNHLQVSTNLTVPTTATGLWVLLRLVIACCSQVQANNQIDK